MATGCAAPAVFRRGPPGMGFGPALLGVPRLVWLHWTVVRRGARGRIRVCRLANIGSGWMPAPSSHQGVPGQGAISAIRGLPGCPRGHLPTRVFAGRRVGAAQPGGWAPGMFVDSWSGNCDHVGTDLRPGRWNGVVRLRFVDASQGWDAADSRRPATGMSTIMIGGDGLISECRWDVRRPMGRRALREV
jgi:hypothetical protein